MTLRFPRFNRTTRHSLWNSLLIHFQFVQSCHLLNSIYIVKKPIQKTIHSSNWNHIKEFQKEPSLNHKNIPQFGKKMFRHLLQHIFETKVLWKRMMNIRNTVLTIPIPHLLIQKLVNIPLYILPHTLLILIPIEHKKHITIRRWWSHEHLFVLNFSQVSVFRKLNYLSVLLLVGEHFLLQTWVTVDVLFYPFLVFRFLAVHFGFNIWYWVSN